MQQAARAFIEEFDVNPRDYCIAVSTFHSNSTRIRSALVEDITKEIKNSDSKLVLLFDTKSCTQLNAAHLPREKRLALIVFSQGSHYGLGVNIVENGTANILSDAMLSTAIEFNLARRLIGLVSDTEVANTGYNGGACVKFESKIDKPLLRLCCRHHIMEIVLKKVQLVLLIFF